MKKRPPDRKLLLAAAALLVAAGAALSRPAVELNQPEGTVMAIFNRLLGPGGS
jgi:hypothetical protein